MRREPEVIDVEPARPPLWRRVVPPVLLLLLLVAAGALLLTKLREPPPLPRLPDTEEVRSDILPRGDSLTVAVQWELAAGGPVAMPASVRIEVGLGDGDIAEVSTVPIDSRADTAVIPAPGPGQTASGYSCVAAVRQGRLGREKCTPWQYVRPAAGEATDTTVARKPPTAALSRIVVQPEGVQVDPDVGGRCAAWQRSHPGESVWIEINRKAVPECTGPNGKPTVAQFCAFAQYPDGRRLPTSTSAAVPYCRQLFQEWSRERIS
jgi:hypothetical protein